MCTRQRLLPCVSHAPRRLRPNNPNRLQYFLCRTFASSKEICWAEQSWSWNGHSINYTVAGSGSPIVLVHGFGASAGQWRKIIPTLAETNKVFAVDLLGFGRSEKALIDYSVELWRDMLADFTTQVTEEPPVLIGNSLGSLVTLAVASTVPKEQIKSVVLLNCAGGMNNKARTDDWRVKLAFPIFLLIDFVLNTPFIASRLFDKFRTADNVRSVLQSIYVNKEAVDDELVQIICEAGDDPNALHVFASVITGPPGPRPEELLESVEQRALILWGDSDVFTPLDGPVGQWAQAIGDAKSNVKFELLENTGHCPQDDNPAAVLSILTPWLASEKVE